MTWQIVLSAYIRRCLMSVEIVKHSGAVIVSDIVGGYRVARTYYGYTRREAVALFRRELSQG
jgi:hypothetical protein